MNIMNRYQVIQVATTLIIHQRQLYAALMFLYSGFALSGDSVRQLPCAPAPTGSGQRSQAQRIATGVCINSAVAVPKRRHKIRATEIKSQDEPSQYKSAKVDFSQTTKVCGYIDMQYQLLKRKTIMNKL